MIVPVPARAGIPRTGTPTSDTSWPPTVRTTPVAESSAARLQWLAIEDAIAWVTEENLRVFLRRVAAVV